MSDALRHELDALSKDELVRRAESQGIEGARKLTRLELIDELVRLGGGPRGFLGKARDLLRDAVEVGLSRVLAPRDGADPAHGSAREPAPRDEPAPAAEPVAPVPGADRVVEAVGASSVEPEATAARPPVVAPAIPTVTLARVYLAQGHAARAREIVEEILRGEPDHRAALELRDELGKREERARSVPPPPPSSLPEEEGVDECVALVVDETAVHVAWDVRPSTLARAERALRGTSPEAQLVLRVLVFEPTVEGPKVTSLDVPIAGLSGDHFARALPPFSIVRAAVGLTAGPRFVPIAHTADVESDPKASAAAPSSGGAPEVVAWSEAGSLPVAPAEAEAFYAAVGGEGSPRSAASPVGGARAGAPGGAGPGPRGATSWTGSDLGGGLAGGGSRPTSPVRVSSGSSISLAERRSGSRV